VEAVNDRAFGACQIPATGVPAALAAEATALVASVAGGYGVGAARLLTPFVFEGTMTGMD